MISKTRVAIVLLLFAATWYLLEISGAVGAVPIKKKLAFLPETIGDYQMAQKVEYSQETLELEGVDDSFQHNYVDPDKNRLNLYVGFFGAVGTTGQYRFPENSLPEGDWKIVSHEEIVLGRGVEGRSSSTVLRMYIATGEETRVVLCWYQNRGRIIASGYLEKLYLVLDSLVQGRRDGAFVRILASADNGDWVAAENRAREFGENVMLLLERHLPGSVL